MNLNGTTLTNPSGVADTTPLSVSGVTQSGPQIDTTTPAFTAVTENPSSGEIGLGTKVTFTLTLNDAVTVDTTNGAPTLKLNDNGIATYDAAASTSTSLVFDYTLTGTDIANVTSLQATSFNLDGAVIDNGAGTAANVSLTGLSQSGPTIDLPQVTGGFAAPSSGTYGAGETMALFVEFNKAVTVTGNITLSLNDGGTATLDAADTALLQQNGYVVFDYKVAPTDHDVSSLSVTGINLNNGTILDSLGDEAQFSGSLPTFSNIAIIQQAPVVVTETAMVTTRGSVSGTAGTAGTGALAGDSDPNGYALTISSINGGTLGSAVHGTYGDLTLNTDGSFSYTAGATSAETTNIAAASGQVTDAFTFSVSDGHGGVTSSTLDVDLNATKPSIASIGFSPSSGDLTIGSTEMITLNLSNVGAIDITSGPTLTLNDGGIATLDAIASTRTSWVFDYQVASTDTNVASLAVSSVNLDGSTLTNPSGAATVTSLPVTGVAQSGPQVDTGPTLTTLYSFGPNLENPAGVTPDSSLLEDAAGDLFGTTEGTQATVFELHNAGNGFYIASGLFNVANNTTTFFPSGPGLVSSLVVDAAGDFFGTSRVGGSGGGGIAFELVNNGNGSYTPKTLLNFSDSNGNGARPIGGLIADAAGDYFGTTENGGAYGEGTVYELVNQGGTYTATILFSFGAAANDGAKPQAGLLVDAAGDLFGTTAFGGTNGFGTVFELVNNGNGSYTPTTLFSFDNTDGANPQASLIADAAGDLFGTTTNGGANGGGGTVFELVNNGNGSYTQKTLLSFDGNNGSDPQGGLLADAAGDLFGTTAFGGTNDNGGTVFELVKNADGSYTLKTLVNFDGADGADPLGGLFADAAGNLFGTTAQGGTGNNGTVFELTDTGFQVACYRRGTLIEIARGQKKVEDLNIGDKVRTASGALRPIKWIGRRSYAGRFVMGRKDILPICIKAGALADNVPARDLWVSPNHAMYFSVTRMSEATSGNNGGRATASLLPNGEKDRMRGVGLADQPLTPSPLTPTLSPPGRGSPPGVLIEAKDLINGVSIVQAERVESVEYFHIELDTHDVIIAEGALAETFIDDDSRGMFHNVEEYHTLYEEQRAAPAHYCAPRLDEGYEVEAVRQRLAQRAGILGSADAPRLGALRGYIDVVSPTCIAGWAQNADAPEAPVCLDIFAYGKLIGRVLANAHRGDLARAGLGCGRHGFTFTPPAGLIFASDAIEVRRSLDRAALERSASRARPNVTVHRRAARGAVG